MGGAVQKKYKIKYTYSSRDDIRGMKKYILDNFKYRELGENFTKKIKTSADGLKIFPTAHNTTGIRYRGYDIYLKPYRYLRGISKGKAKFIDRLCSMLYNRL